MCESLENSKKLMDHIKNYYIKNTKISIEFLDEQLKKDLTWDSSTCLEYGLVDEII
jgi:ATP-dependent protease ClpP protease subunit